MDNLDSILLKIQSEWIFIADNSEDLFKKLKPEDIKTLQFLTNKLNKFRIFALQFASSKEKEAAEKLIEKKKEEVSTITIFKFDQVSNCFEGIIAFNKTHQKAGIKD